MDSLKVFYCATLEIKSLFERCRCQRLVRVICVQYWLLKFLDECFMVQAGEVKSVEVCCAPELSLLQLLLIDCLVSERHDT